VPFDAISYLLARKALSRGIILPTLKDLVIDADKDWQGRRIMNLGEPVDPHDAARRIYVDAAATGLGINYYFLDAADTEVPAYKQLSLTPPELSEAYAEYTSNSAGDYEIASWIAPADSIAVLRLGVYTTHFQAERVSGGLDVRFFFRLYERDSGGSETLIAESSLSDLVTDRRDVITSLVLASDHEMAEGSRLVLKIYVRYLSSGPSTTGRLYYQGDVRSRLATPIAKEILDGIYAGIIHASRHALGGPDELSLDASQIASGILSADRIPGLDASKIVSGILNVARIPDLSRSKITDLFNTPFWDNIPDKPFDTLGSELLVSAGELQIAGIDASKIISGILDVARIPDLDASKITSGVFALARIPNIDWTRISGNFPRSISDLISSAFSRSWISDLFSSPFWDNIPDKPSVFPPDLHAAAHGLGGADELSLDASQIASGILSAARIPNLDASKITSGVFDVARIPNLDASKITSGVFDVARIPDLVRSKITDFFSSPFWNNIPDKPSTFPPSSHTHTRSEVTDFWATPFWDNIPDKPAAMGFYAPYAGDETELSTTSTSYTVMKEFNFTYLSSVGITPSQMIVVVEGYNNTSGQTTTVGIYIDGNLQAEISFTETSYTVKTTTIDLSALGLSDGAHNLQIKMKVTGGTGYIRLTEVWMK